MTDIAIENAIFVVGARPIDGRGVLSIFWHFFRFLMVLHVN